MSVPALVLDRISKKYGGNPVLSDVTLEVAPGEIHALVGENGAGKSTLMNVLFGMPVIRETGGYEGQIRLGGAVVDPETPADAMAHGVGMVHQEFMLLPGFTVTENIKLNRERTRPTLASRLVAPASAGAARGLEMLDMATMRGDARGALDRIGLSLDEMTLVDGLPVGHMQLIEIAREVDKSGAKVVVFDEPTAVLTETEATELLAVMKRLATDGIAILFITHRLDEVLEVADRISVLRDGELVARLGRAEASMERIAELMIGRSIPEREPDSRPDPSEADVLLAIEDLHVDMPGERVHGVSLDVRRGEILGIAGLAGQGKLGIANGVTGLYPATGRVHLAGKPLPLGDPAAALARGVAFVSEDRRGVGLLLDESIAWNIASTATRVRGRFLHGRGPLALLDRAGVDRHATALIEAFDIRCRGPRQPVGRLSGGNQQKVCIARAYTLEPELLFVSEPTRGVDVGAKARVLDVLVDMNHSRGTTIVLTSSELAELRRVADRIAVIDAGRVKGIVAPDVSDVELGLLLGGES